MKRILPTIFMAMIFLPLIPEKSVADTFNLKAGTTGMFDPDFDIFRNRHYMRYFSFEWERAVFKNLFITGEFTFGWESNTFSAEDVEESSRLTLGADLRQYGLNVGGRYRFLLKDFFRPYLRVYTGGYWAAADFTGNLTEIEEDSEDSTEEENIHTKDYAWCYGLFTGAGIEFVIPNKYFRERAKEMGREMREWARDFEVGFRLEAGHLFTPGLDFQNLGLLKMGGLQINGGVAFYF